MVRAAPGLGDDMVNLEQLKWEVRLAPVAQSLLLAEEGVLVLPVVDGGVNVRPAGNDGAGSAPDERDQG